MRSIGQTVINEHNCYQVEMHSVLGPLFPVKNETKVLCICWRNYWKKKKNFLSKRPIAYASSAALFLLWSKFVQVSCFLSKIATTLKHFFVFLYYILSFCNKTCLFETIDRITCFNEHDFIAKSGLSRRHSRTFLGLHKAARYPLGNALTSGNGAFPNDFQTASVQTRFPDD